MTPEQMLQRAIHGVPAYAMFAMDDRGYALSWNRGVLQVLGYEQDDFIGRSMDELFTAEDRKRGEPAQERADAARESGTGTFRWHMRRDGSRLWANGNTQAVRDDDGSLAGFAKIVLDANRERELRSALERSREEFEERVDERTSTLIRVAEELRKSEGRLVQVFRVAPAPMVLTSCEDDILDANDAFEGLTGYGRDELVGRNAKSLGFWSSPEDKRKLGEAGAPREGFNSLALQLRTKERDIRDIVGSAVALEGNGKLTLMKMFVDTTESKQNERFLLKALHSVMSDASWLAQRVVEKLSRAQATADGTEVVDLTQREREVLALVAQGASNEEIGRRLGLAVATVRNHLNNVYAKTGVRSRAQAVVWARDRGLGMNVPS